MLGKKRTYILQLGHDDEKRELLFELDFQRRLSTTQRFRMMFEVSNRIKEMLIAYGHRKPIEVIKRA